MEFCLSPLLSERLQIRSPEIFRRHGDPKLHFRIECEEPRLSKRRDIRRITNVHDQSSGTSAVVFGEISSFGLDGLKNSLHLLSNAAVSDGSVERFEWEFNVHQHPHNNPPSAGIPFSAGGAHVQGGRSEEHTSELQSLR